MRRLTRTHYHWAVVLALSVLLGAGVAWAHPNLLAMEPPADAQLKEPPPRLQITFDQPLEAISTLALRDSGGREVATGGVPRPDSPASLVLELPRIGPGLYTMAWTVVGSDGHIVKGNAAFSVLGDASAFAASLEPASAPTPPNPAPAPEPLPLAAILLRGIMLVGALAGTGGLAFLIWVLGPALAQVGGDPAALYRWQAWLTIPLLLCAVAAPLMFVYETSAAFGAVSLTGLLRVASTRYGQVLLVRAGLALALAIAAAQLRREQHIRHGVCLALSAWLLLNFSLGGHAAADPAPTLTILADAIHLGATALWAGGLLAFATMLPGALRSLPAERHPDLLKTLFAQFSAMALVSVAMLIVTGTYAALRRLGALSDLWTTSYGLALLTKLVVFGAMLLFGAYFLLMARPRLDAWAATAPEHARQLPRLLGRTLHLEAALALIAIIAAGALTSLAPPSAATAGGAAPITPLTPTAIRVPTITPGPTRTCVPSQPFDLTQAAGDLRVRLEVSPASIGDDRFRVTVTDQGAGRCRLSWCGCPL